MGKEIVSAFDQNAEDYARWYKEKPGSLIFESEVKALKIFPLKGVGIDIGAGTGEFSARLKIPIGLDPSLNMLEIAKRRGISTIQGFGEFLPVKNQCLDYILIILTICFLDTPTYTLTEAWRILKYGGNLIVGFIPRDSHWGKQYMKKKSQGHKIYKHADFYTLNELERLLGQVGFTIEGYSATLSHEIEQIAEIEAPSDDIDKHGFICVKTTKHKNRNHPQN